MEGNTKNNKKTDKEKLAAIKGLLRPRKRRFYKSGKETSQEVIFHVSDNSELRYVISCLLRVSIAALELEGTPSSPRTPYLSNELAIVTILELINDILPDDQLESYDAIEKLFLAKEVI
ncbi:hypothetical protein [Yeosuana marina]|uniref:hypothetical protein n=1 Tax=Yeosuana marina TaxID=1565536 RepID=UPI0030EEC153|tara:strand:+ start:1650 stop:2006 length:357 start_codon:yes stop_codon:yes gene_type:complete